MTCGCWTCLLRLNEWGAHQAWLLALIPDYLYQSNPATGKKLAEERGLFDCGGGLWRDTAGGTYSITWQTSPAVTPTLTYTYIHLQFPSSRVDWWALRYEELMIAAATRPLPCSQPQQLVISPSSILCIPFTSITAPLSARKDSPVIIRHHGHMSATSVPSEWCSAAAAAALLHSAPQLLFDFSSDKCLSSDLTHLDDFLAV